MKYLYICLVFIFPIMRANAQNSSNNNKAMNSKTDITFKNSTEITGTLSGKKIVLPGVNDAPMPFINVPDIFYNGKPIPNFNIKLSPGNPDSRSFNKKFALLIPATNTIVEHEMWSIIFNNQGEGGLDGVGIHTTNIETPIIQVKTDADLQAFKNQYIEKLNSAIEQASLSQPEYLIMGMSLEHILHGISEIDGVMNQIESMHKYSWSTWTKAADAALKKYHAKRIGIITPWTSNANQNAIKMFQDLGYEVVADFGFSCTKLVDIAHIPDEAKEEAILKYLATPENKLDAIVQCGSNMSMLNVSEKLEKQLGIPILGINAVTLWYALRENGFTKPLNKSSRLLKEF